MVSKVTLTVLIVAVLFITESTCAPANEDTRPQMKRGNFLRSFFRSRKRDCTTKGQPCDPTIPATCMCEGYDLVCQSITNTNSNYYCILSGNTIPQ